MTAEEAGQLGHYFAVFCFCIIIFNVTFRVIKFLLCIPEHLRERRKVEEQLKQFKEWDEAKYNQWRQGYFNDSHERNVK